MDASSKCPDTAHTQAHGYLLFDTRVLRLATLRCRSPFPASEVGGDTICGDDKKPSTSMGK